MIVIDANALVLLIVGLIDKNLINTHKRLSIYSIEDFEDLLTIINRDFSKIVTIPNVWTEVDNLLNNFTGENKSKYCRIIKNLEKESNERYFKSSEGINNIFFRQIGLTDSLILALSKNCDFLITADSELSDYAKANNIEVYDLVEASNKKM